MKLIGADGCPGGWAAVCIEAGKIESGVFSAFSEIVEAFSPFDLLLADMPIGLPENQREAENRPEPLARKLLKGRASSIFNVPCRQAVVLDDYAAASGLNREVLGKGLSKQSFYIMKKIHELDAYLQNRTDLQGRIKESHPELAFAMLAGEPLAAGKKTEAGLAERLQLLKRFVPVTKELETQIEAFPAYRKVRGDLVDACCLAVTAQLGLEKGFVKIPEHPAADRTGLMMQMHVYTESDSKEGIRHEEEKNT